VKADRTSESLRARRQHFLSRRQGDGSVNLDHVVGEGAELSQTSAPSGASMAAAIAGAHLAADQGVSNFDVEENIDAAARELAADGGDIAINLGSGGGAHSVLPFEQE
jgi:hypothetical protein